MLHESGIDLRGEFNLHPPNLSRQFILRLFFTPQSPEWDVNNLLALQGIFPGEQNETFKHNLQNFVIEPKHKIQYGRSTI